MFDLYFVHFSHGYLSNGTNMLTLILQIKDNNNKKTYARPHMQSIVQWF